MAGLGQFVFGAAWFGNAGTFRRGLVRCDQVRLGRLGKARSGTLRFVPVGQVRCVVASFGKDSWGKAR